VGGGEGGGGRKGAPQWGWRPLQPPEAVDDDSVAAWKWWAVKRQHRGRGHGQGIGGRGLKAVGAVWVLSVQETGTRGPWGFDFFQFILSRLNLEIKKECLIFLQKFATFACCSIGAL
jgi:hypothetical protein